MADQTRILDYTEDPNQAFGDFRDYLGEVAGRVRNRVQSAGIDLDWWADSPFDADLTDDDELWAYQYVEAYSKDTLTSGQDYIFDPNKGAAETGSPSPQVQFKVGIYVVGQPTTEIMQRLNGLDMGRLITLFDTREYAGYMSGFGFSHMDDYTQREEVSAREVSDKGYGLGVPWFEVETYDEDGSLTGYADGYFNPFTRETTTIPPGPKPPEPPQREVWTFGGRHAHDSGERYRIAPEPDTPARERAKQAAGKTAYIGGFPVGRVLKGGRIQLKVEYSNPNLAQYTSRKQIIEQSGIPYQALSQGANLYKVREEEDKIWFSTTQPDDWEPADPDDIDPSAVGGEATTAQEVTDIILDPDEPTQFVVKQDERETRMMGLYDTPVIRDIERETELV